MWQVKRNCQEKVLTNLTEMFATDLQKRKTRMSEKRDMLSLCWPFLNQTVFVSIINWKHMFKFAKSKRLVGETVNFNKILALSANWR